MNIRNMNQRTLGLILGVVLVLSAVGYVALRMGPLAPTRVTVAAVEQGRLTPSVFGIGTVEARQSWMLGPTVAGRVSHVYVDVGEHVHAGQTLAEMDPGDFDARLRAQDAALQRARSAVAAARAQQSDVQAKLALAQESWRQQQALAAQHFISAIALQAQEQTLHSAQAAVSAAQANVDAAAQEHKRLVAEREAMRVQRAKLLLVAPADAVVVSRDAEVGSTVVAGQAVLKLINPDSLWVKMRVDQGRSSGLKRGLSAQIVLRSQPLASWAGEVARVEWLADAVTEERLAQVRFLDRPQGVAVGEVAEVKLALAAVPDALLVPQASVQVHQGQRGVWRVRADALAFVPVVWGGADEQGRVQAISGLALGDQVVAYSEKPLSAGLRVQVVDALLKTAQP